MISDEGPKNLWSEILAFGETSFDKIELAMFIESRYKRPFIALRGNARTSGSNDIEGLVVHLLRALKNLGYLDCDVRRHIWTIRKERQRP